MHISSMRSAYDKDSRLLTGKRRDVDNAPKSNLDLSLGDTRGTPQHVPSFSPTTISSVERSIAHILLSMTRRGIRCIGLIATDVRDQLFLAEQVRFYCPEVQLVLFRADSIFTHPDVGPALEGSLIATTYPLISKNQKWTALDPRSASRRISFTNVASEGVYNATLALLAQSDLPVPGGSESSRCSDDQPRAANGPASRVAFEPLEYRTPFEDIGDGYHVAPPVWLTAVSNGEFWPIAVVPREKWQPLEQQQLPKNGDDKTIRDTPGNAQDASENDRHYVLRAVSEKKPHHSYRDSSATYGDPDIEDGLRGMLGLIATGFSGFCVVSSLRYLAGHIVATAGGDDAFRHYWWPVPYFLSLLAAEIALASPTLVHLSLWLRGRVSFCFGTDNWRRQAVILAVLATEHAALGAVFAAVAVGTVLAMRRPRIRQDCARVPAVVMRTVSWSFIAAAAVEAVVLYLVSNPSKPLSDAAIFLERSARFGDRVTPTLPCFFVAIAIAWWFRGHLQRRSFADRFPLLNPFERAPQQPRDLNYAGLTQIIRPLVGCLESGRGWPSRNDAEDFTWRAVLGHGFASVSRVLAWHTLIIFPFLFLVVAWAHSLAAYESAQFNTVVWLTWLAVVGLFWLTIWQFLWGSYVFLELLRRLARHPMADAFQRLPRKTRKALAWLLLSRLPRRFELEASLRIWQSLQCAVPGLAENSNNTSLRTHLDGLQLAAHYNYPSGDGSGQTVGLLEFGGGYFPDDLKKFCSLAGISPPTVTAISTDGTSTSAKDGAEGEVMLDIEVVAGVCPEANIAVYFAQWTEIGWITALDAAIQDSHNDPGVLSISWGAPEDTDIWTEQAMTQVNESFLEAAHLGITVCLAAGDDGSSDADLDGHAHVDFPGSSPYVLSVGGTTVLADDGSAPDVAWKEGDGLRNDNGGSTGGGVSAVFPRPAWQAGLDNIISVNPGAILGRCIPDLSANADWTASPYLLVVDGHAQPNGGTSAASPLVAALITRINGQRGPGKRLGYVTPVLYQKLGAQAVGALGCTDVESGDNNTSQVGGYSAGPGYDAASGWGTPNGQNLLHVLNMALLNGPAGAPAGAGAGAGGSAAG
ncbi:MAG TPA: S53 family peptidase [Pirellulales bacterium]|nr:S53 family peptidase [Pirellulales bacterium]